MKGSPSVRKAQFRHGSVVILALLTSCFEVSEDSPGGDPDTGLSAGSGAPATCGNGALDPGEECDDGILSVSGACVPGCKRATCGDGHLWLEREVCDDGNNSNEDDCVDCSPARCGDGYVWAGREDCDDGNWFNGDSCPATCRFDRNESSGEVSDGVDDESTASGSSSGALLDESSGTTDLGEFGDTDSVAETGETSCICQFSDTVCLAEGEASPDEPCRACSAERGTLVRREQGTTCGERSMCLSGVCTEVRRVFTTYLPYGDSDAADAACNARGKDYVDADSTWLAWLAGPAVGPVNRFEHFDGPYVNVLGAVVADDWNMLVSTGDGGGLRSPMNVSEAGSLLESVLARTGTTVGGSEAQTCEDWTLADDDSFGLVGSVNSVSQEWTSYALSCNNVGLVAVYVYCFEQR